MLTGSVKSLQQGVCLLAHIATDLPLRLPQAPGCYACSRAMGSARYLSRACDAAGGAVAGSTLGLPGIHCSLVAIEVLGLHGRCFVR